MPCFCVLCLKTFFLQEQNVKTVDAESPQRPMTEEAGVSLNELAYRRFKQALVNLSTPPVAKMPASHPHPGAATNRR